MNYVLAPKNCQATHALEKPKVLFLSPVGFFKGGAERSLQDLLSNPYITPILMAPEDGPILQTANAQFIQCQILDVGSINTIRRPFSFRKGLGVLLSLYKASSTLKAFCKKQNIGIVHSNGLKAHMINVISRRFGGPTAIIHIRDIPYTLTEKIVWQIMHLLCDKMVLVSAPCWPGKILPRKAIVIHNGIDAKKLPHNPIKIPSETTVLGFVGRIHPAKGLHLLLNWHAQAIKKGKLLKLSVRDSFSDDAPDYEREITEQIKSLQISDHIEFLGHINDPDKVYKDLDIVVVPSETPDPLPRSVMEAMALGLIVFGYPTGGITDMIDDGVTGYLVNDANSFSRALSEIQSHPQKKQLISENSKKKISEKFTISNLHKITHSLYSDFF